MVKEKKTVRGDIKRTLDKHVEVMYTDYNNIQGDSFRNQLSKVVIKFEDYNYDMQRYRDAINIYDSGSKKIFSEYYQGLK